MTASLTTSPGGNWLVPVLSAGNFCIGMGAFVVIGMLNPLADGLGLSASEAGWVMTVYALAYAVGSPVVVALSGTWSRRLVLTFGLVLFGLAALVSALSLAASTLFAARALAALGAGLFTPIAAAVAAATSPPQQRGKSLAAVFFGLTLAQVMGVPAGSFIAYTFGWQSAFIIVAGLSAVIAVAVWLLVPRSLEFMPTSLATLADTLIDWRAMLNVSYTATLMAAIYIVYGYLAPLLRATMGYGRDELTLVLLVFGCGAVVGNLLGGYLTDRIGAALTLTVISLVQLLVMPAFSWLPMAAPLLLLLVMLWSVSGWSFMAPQQSRLVNYSTQNQAVLLALNAAAIYVGISIGTTIGGLVLDTWGLSALGVAGGIAAAAALLHLLVSAQAGRGRSA